VVIPSPTTIPWMKAIASLRGSRIMSSTFVSAIRAENTFELVVGIIDRMAAARCYKSREGNPRIALIAPPGAVRVLHNEKTANAQR
jgi:hypothetical protein